MEKNNVIGEESYDKYGCCMKTIDYKNYNKITVQFQDEFKTIVNTAYREFKKGVVRNPNAKSVVNIGVIGNEETMDSIDHTKHLKSYVVWRNMIVRCYSEDSLKEKPTYKGCTVCEEWHNYTNFKKWYNENYYEIKEDVICLDKDILVKGNKVYSSDTCIFVPQTINKLFTKRNMERGNTPIGVVKVKDKYYSCCSNGKGNKDLYGGRFDTIEDAFLSYKQMKEDRIKQVADDYKSKYPNFPQKLYNAMYRYEVEITD